VRYGGVDEAESKDQPAANQVAICHETAGLFKKEVVTPPAVRRRSAMPIRLRRQERTTPPDDSQLWRSFLNGPLAIERACAYGAKR
jgi:hypothetical protein